MTHSTDTYIAGWKTADDWRRFREQLVNQGGRDLWQRAFEDYFLERLHLRYLGPIRMLQGNGTFQGEGFSIVAIQCTLIEFLESTVQGIQYRYLRRGERLGEFEYSSSRDIFVNFLCCREPFMRQFEESLAQNFYEGIRCGLLHEARTKNGWKIWARDPRGRVVDGQQRIVFRDNFQEALSTFVDWYKAALLSDTQLQQAFIRKFDSLCD
jgi:hypothetical protein